MGKRGFIDDSGLEKELKKAVGIGKTAKSGEEKKNPEARKKAINETLKNFDSGMKKTAKKK